jgi:hypothetical protein
MAFSKTIWPLMAHSWQRDDDDLGIYVFFVKNKNKQK